VLEWTGIGMLCGGFERMDGDWRLEAGESESGEDG